MAVTVDAEVLAVLNAWSLTLVDFTPICNRYPIEGGQGLTSSHTSSEARFWTVRLISWGQNDESSKIKGDFSLDGTDLRVAPIGNSLRQKRINTEVGGSRRLP